MGLRTVPFALLLANVLYSVGGCPDGFVPWHEGYCYSLTPASHWDGYWSMCNLAGGAPASIHSLLERTRILASLSSLGHSESVWIGLHCMGVPAWIDMTPYDFSSDGFGNPCWSTKYVSTNYAYAMNSAGGWGPAHFDDLTTVGVCRHRKRNGERCSDYDEIEGSNTCISVRNEAQTWWLAENKCQQESAHLVSIHDQNVNDHIEKKIRNAEIAGPSGAFLIGMQSQATQKGESLTWSDGSDVNFTNFDIGSPTDALGQCTAMETIAGGKWMSTNCEGSSLPYICGRPVNTPIQAPHCPGNPNFKDSGTIMSPSYPASSGPLNNCQYFLTVAQGMRVKLAINDLNTNLCCDKLMLYDGIAATTPFATLSGKADQMEYTTPTSNVLKMVYSSTDGTFVRGWKVTFSGV